MKKFFIISACLILFMIFSVSGACANERSLYDFWGNPVAYISAEPDSPIYIWDGLPLAYLEKNGTYYNVYGFNGKHLGWFENGVIWDHKGRKVGFVKGAPNTHVITRAELEKGSKKPKPEKMEKEPEPVKPSTQHIWSNVTLTSFLYNGQRTQDN